MHCHSTLHLLRKFTASFSNMGACTLFVQTTFLLLDCKFKKYTVYILRSHRFVSLWSGHADTSSLGHVVASSLGCIVALSLGCVVTSSWGHTLFCSNMLEHAQTNQCAWTSLLEQLININFAWTNMLIHSNRHLCIPSRDAHIRSCLNMLEHIRSNN